MNKELDDNLNAEIERLVAQEPDPDPSRDPFNSPAMKKARLKALIKEALEFRELSKYIESALKVVIEDGKKHLSEEQYQTLMDTFSHAPEILSHPHESEENYQNIFHITDEEMDAIGKVALEDYNLNQFADCMAVFILLSTLCPENPDYWQRAGIAAHKAGALDQALKFYKALDAEEVASHLLLIDCYLALNRVQEAEDELRFAKNLTENKALDEASKALLSQIEMEVAALHSGGE